MSILVKGNAVENTIETKMISFEIFVISYIHNPDFPYQIKKQKQKELDQQQ